MRTAEPEGAAQSGAAMTGVEEAVAGFGTQPSPLPLDCGVQHYDWGDTGFIPDLIGEPNPAGRPFAELWIGAHPDLPSLARIGETPVSLDRLIDALPEPMLGAAAMARFGPRLPFLFKVLAARRPLSIQAHPNAEQARAGFARENRAGVPLTDPRRSYRDPSHKPELVVALTEFHALRGFRPLPEIAAELAAWPSLAPLAARLDAGVSGLEALYRELMEADQADVNGRLDPIIAEATRQRSGHPFDPADRRDWLLEADRDFSRPDSRDRGLFSLLLLNLVQLRPGAALYLPAGELHCYLRGAAVEVMANSNNVLRGGLTSKHIDVAELLRVLRLDPGPAELVRPTAADHPELPHAYRVPAAEFALEQHEIAAGETRRLDGGRLRLGLVMDGAVHIDCPRGQGFGVRRGHAFVIPAACVGALRGDEAATVFTARVP